MAIIHIVALGCGQPPADEPAGTAVSSRAAPVERSLRLTASEDPPIGISAAGTVCDDSLFLVDPRHAAVHEFRLSNGARSRVLGGLGDSAEALASPQTAAADCRRNTLYVKDSRGLARFDLETGSLAGRDSPAPGMFGVSLGWSFVHDRWMVLPGYWSQSSGDLASRPLETALQGFALGSRIDLAAGDGASQPVLDLISPSCRQAGGDCFATAGLDRLSTGGWVGCQGHADHLGVFADDGELLRTIDIRSPGFKDDGSTARASASTDARRQWQQRNSVVRSCFSFGEHVVTVHYTFTGEGGTPETGGAVPHVLMNVHRLDGTPVALDLELRDVPVARDDEMLYVLVLGDARRGMGAMEVELDLVRIVDASGALNPALAR